MNCYSTRGSSVQDTLDARRRSARQILSRQFRCPGSNARSTSAGDRQPRAAHRARVYDVDRHRGERAGERTAPRANGGRCDSLRTHAQHRQPMRFDALCSCGRVSASRPTRRLTLAAASAKSLPAAMVADVYHRSFFRSASPPCAREARPDITERKHMAGRGSQRAGIRRRPR